MTITRSFLIRYVALMLMPAVVSCSTWRTAPVAPRALVENSQPKVVRVTPLDRKALTLRHPFIRNDSLVGRLENNRRTGVVFLEDVATIETRKFDPLKTAGFAYFVGLVAAAITAGVSYVLFLLRCSAESCSL